MTSSGRWRRSVGAVASGCVAATTFALTGCSPIVAPEPAGTPIPSRTTESGLPVDTIRSIADELRASVICEHPDPLFDDLAFWDAMRGFDCSSARGPVFIRVYAHAASIPQTLEDWNGTFGTDRALARGDHWYVIGPPSVVSTVQAPPGQPVLTGPPPAPAPLTAEEDYLTTCARYVASEGDRYIEHPERRSSSAEQYETLFPGVTSALHAAVDGLHPEGIRNLDDRDRWIAALSPIGPRMKEQCGKAYKSVHDTVHAIDGSNS